MKIFSKNLWDSGILSLFLIAIFTFNCASSGGTKKNTKAGYTVGNGHARIYSDDLALARERAVDQAKKDAVEKKLGELIKGKKIVENGRWVKGELTAESHGVVKDYRVSSEKQEDGYLLVTIQAYIEESKMENAVNSLLHEWEKPVVFMQVKETIDSKSNTSQNTVSSNGFAKFFISKNFEVTKDTSWLKSRRATSDMNSLMRYAQSTGAPFDILLYADTQCTKFGPIMNTKMYSGQVTMDISVVDIHTGSVIATSTIEDKEVHIDINKACKTAIERGIESSKQDIFQQIVKKWDKEFGSGKIIVLDLSGRNLEYKKMYQFQKDLRNNLRGVVEVLEKKFTPTHSIIHVIYKGRSSEFMDEIANKSLTYKMTIKQRAGNKITATLSPAK